MERSMEDIQKEYSQLCAEAGQLQYKMSVHKQDLKELNIQLQKLNTEAAAMQKASLPKDA